jgi:hypothetical protein
MQLDQVGIVSLQQPIQFFNLMRCFAVDYLAMFRFDIAVEKFHWSTLFRVGSPREGAFAWRQSEHSAARHAIQYRVRFIDTPAFAS